MALTLALHWAFLSVVVGGAIIVVLHASKPDPGQVKLNRAVVGWFPFALSMAMTMGIAPLLFVQVLYGNLFYTSNILLGYWWLALVPLLIVDFYLLYWARRRSLRDTPMGGVTLAIATAIFIAIATVLSSNATLMQTPEAWAKIWGAGGNRLYLSGRTLLPRLLFAIFGLVGGGAIFFAIFGKAGWARDPDANQTAIDKGLGMAGPALVVQILFGILLLAILPKQQRAGALSGVGLVLFIVSGLAFLATAALTFRARAKTDLIQVVLPAATFFVGLFALAGLRDVVRQAAIAPHFKLETMPVNSQWDSFALFLVMFLAGLGAVAWLIKLSRASQEAAAEPQEPAPSAQATG